ncbi:MAG: hypothetical protein IKO42_03695, partial [Opitutales bacterium]|nr:hypothetical protein [Opitutales bacterium]
MKRLLITFVLGIAALCASGRLAFKNIYSDRLVLQADYENLLAGYAGPEETVEVELNFAAAAPKKLKAAAGKDGKWVLKLPKMRANTELEIVAKTSSESARIKDVKVGQLWLASGQSNMDWHFDRAPKTPEYAEYLKNLGEYLDSIKGMIRIYKVRQVASFEPLENVEGGWIEPDLAHLKNFSALPLLFAKILNAELKEPIGVVVSSWGGSPIERWVPREAFNYSDFTRAALERDAINVEGWQGRKEKYLLERKEWLEKNNTPELRRQNRKTEPQFKYDPFDRSTPTPGMLFNGMICGIYPLVPKGVIWYQGESNDRRANEYGDLAKAMVLSWRKFFKSELPFYYVELANLNALQKIPVEKKEHWGAIREAQGAVLSLPKTGVATCADVGDPNDLHPPYKDEVARRLARLALTQIYKKGNPASAISPSYKSAKFNGGE